MVPIGEEPVLWHIMRHYAFFGFRDFVVAFGYQAGSVQHYVEETGEACPDRSRGDEHRCYRKGGVNVELVEDDDTHFESRTLARLAKSRELMAYHHESFRQCMDMLKETQTLNALWADGQAPWKS